MQNMQSNMHYMQNNMNENIQNMKIICKIIWTNYPTNMQNLYAKVCIICKWKQHAKLSSACELIKIRNH